MSSVSTRVRRFSAVALLVATTGAGAFIAGQASARQPHMNAALDSLRAAKSSLERASDDKGGHRAKALSLTKDAIDQVERGIRYDRRN